MRVMCIGRHQFLSEHLARYFGGLGVDAIPCVGMNDALRRAADDRPDAVACDYDLLASLPAWSATGNSGFSQIPIIAVSLTRHATEAHLSETSGIAGFMYLPTQNAEDAHRVLAALRQKTVGINPPSVLKWPNTTQVAGYR
jgi:hypothetical protein